MFKRSRRTSMGAVAGEEGEAGQDAEIGYSTQGSYGLKKCYDRQDAAVDIVFVHGLTGNRESTWTSESGVFWPEVLLKRDTPNARILTFGYDADVVHFWAMASQNQVGGHAKNLVNAIAQLHGRTDTTERPIFFVVHSLGGLVVADALLASRNSAEPHIRQILESTAGIAFLGTPHCGADLAQWAKMCGSFTSIFKRTNKSLLSALQPNSEVLARIQQEFHTMLRARKDAGNRALEITCFYEELPVRGVGEIVPMHSAILREYNNIGIRANHMDMTKFDSAEDPGYLAVSGELIRWTKAVSTASIAAQVTTESQYGQSYTSPTQAPAISPPRGPSYGSPYNPYQVPQDYNQWPHQVSYSQQPLSFTPHNAPYGASLQGSATPLQQHSQPEYGARVYQSANIIQGQTTISGNGKAVQGNNISSEKDVTLNF